MDSQTQSLLKNDYAVAPYPIKVQRESSSMDQAHQMSERHVTDTIQIPIEKSLFQCQASGALLKGQVQRLSRSGSDRRAYRMILQANGKEFPILVAEKDHPKTSWRMASGSTSRYIIRSFRDHALLGCLTKSGTVRDSTITYTLTHRSFDDCPIAYIRYEVPTVMQVLKEYPPRRVFLEIPGRGTAASKEPMMQPGEGHKSLDFQGRGREASRKNMQLQNKGGQVLLQFAKWNKDVFNLDFS